MSKESFIEAIKSSYPDSKPHIFLGCGVLDGEILSEARVNIPLSMMNRHGMVAGATGSGKTRTLQLLAEQLSKAGVPVFLSDIKGDLSGLGVPGKTNAKLEERAEALGIKFEPSGVPVELYSLSGNNGAQMRATVMEFGPILLSKILELNDTQTGVLTILFKYADDHALPIVDLNDLKKVLNYLSEGPGKEEIRANYGSISTSSSGTILRKIVALEQQEVDKIFGEPSFEIADLMQKVDGQGVVSILNVSDMQDKPDVFSTFLLSLLAELYQTLPEAGDLDKPKLVFFLDEAHLLFNDAPKAFLEQIEQIVRLIRSKGVGIFFCSQMAQDLPDSVLSQLGNRVQHVLRSFTPKDAKAIKDTVHTYPRSEYYKIDETLTQLGIGQALITVLNSKGIPTEVAYTHLVPPVAVMGPMIQQEVDDLLRKSELYAKYRTTVDPESAFEILDKRIRGIEKEEEQIQTKVEEVKPQTSGRKEKSVIEEVMSSSVTRTIGRELVRGIFGVLFGKKTTTRRTTRR
ncbi:MAG: helicase HerA-like domain-containing protein [Bacteroidia bacterium]